MSSLSRAAASKQLPYGFASDLHRSLENFVLPIPLGPHDSGNNLAQKTPPDIAYQRNLIFENHPEQAPPFLLKPLPFQTMPALEIKQEIHLQNEGRKKLLINCDKKVPLSLPYALKRHLQLIPNNNPSEGDDFFENYKLEGNLRDKKVGLHIAGERVFSLEY